MVHGVGHVASGVVLLGGCINDVLYYMEVGGDGLVRLDLSIGGVLGEVWWCL